MGFISLIIGKKSIKKFTTIYCLGNIIIIAATGFLIGFFKQFKLMCKATRWIASTIYLTSLIGCIFVSLFMPSNPLKNLTLLSLIIIQLPSYIWYCLSYIPFGRKIMRKICRGCIGSFE